MLNVQDWLVIAACVAGIAATYWWFFGAERAAAVAAVGGAAQQQTIVVRGGYEPATIRVKAGTPVRLVFDRQETNGCSEEVVFPAFSVRRFLPAFQRTAIDLPAPAAGTYEFTCGMSMLRGRVIAE